MTHSYDEMRSEKSCDAAERWMLDRRSFLLAGLLGLGGCQSWFSKGKTDLSSAELPDDDGTIYVSNMTRVWGAAPTRINGVGMVTELPGTGSAPRPSRYRDELAEELRIREVEDPNTLLSADWTSLAVLTGWIPAGARKGQTFDVQVGLDPNSDTSSLEGGFLMPARMNPIKTAGGQIMKGRFAATATGPVLTESIFRDANSSAVKGVIAGGGSVMMDRPFGFRMKSDHRSIKEAIAVTKAMNQRFNYIENAQREPVASAKNDQAIELQVPQIYRDNVYRYLHVLRNVAVAETSARQVTRLEQLEQQLANPETTEVASLRLEAIGNASVGVLERALRNPLPKVRFMAAMALTYLGKTSGCGELGQLAADEWAFRWHALTALSALPQPEARTELQKLLHQPSVETRYGAVRSLIQRGESEGEMTIDRFGKHGENFSLNTIYSTADPVVHIAKFKQPEIAVFNADQTVLPGLVFVARNWTIKSRSDQMVEIIHYQSDGADQPVRCSALVTDVVRTLGQMDAKYSMVVRMLRQAANEQLLQGRLVINALPESDRAYTPSSNQSESMPAMFAGEDRSTESFDEVDETEAELHDIRKASEEATLLGKLKGLSLGK